MKITVILPHLLHNGGVRRFIELGNEFIKLGYPFEIAVPNGYRKDWDWNFLGNIVEGWSDIKSDIVITGDTTNLGCLRMFEASKAKKKFIYVIIGKPFHAIYKQYYKKYPFILNNRVFLKYYDENVYLIEGGVSDFWKPANKIKIGYQSRKSHKQITDLSELEHIELVPFSGMNDEQLREAYRSVDYVVTWEEREGWCNTAAEALACGTPVVTNGVNCEPFIEKCIVVDDLKEFFKSMQHLTYKENVKKLIKIFES